MAVANTHMLDELYSFTTCDVLITDLETGVEIYSGKLKSHAINKTTNKTPIKAGIGGITWVELEDSSEITVEIVNLEERIDLEALKLSGVAKPKDETDFTLVAFPKNYTLGAGAGTTLTVDLPNAVLAGETVTVYRTDTNVPLTPQRISFNGGRTQIIIKTEQLTIGTDGVDEPALVGFSQNDIVLVGSYQYTQDKAEVIHISPESIGTNVSVTLKQPLYGADRKVKMWRQYHFYRCSLGSEFTQESATELAEQNTSSSFTVLKDPKHDTLGYIAYVPVTPAYGYDNAPFSVTKSTKTK